MSQLMCEVVGTEIVAGPGYFDDPKCGRLLPCHLTHAEITDPETQQHGDPEVRIEESFVSVHYPIAQKPSGLILMDAQLSAKEQIKSWRKQAVAQGITVPGVPSQIPGTSENQEAIAGLLTLATGAEDTDMFPVNTVTGRFLVNKAKMLEVASGMYTHVQQCFSRQRVLDEAVDACVVPEDIRDIVAAGW